MIHTHTILTYRDISLQNVLSSAEIGPDPKLATNKEKNSYKLERK